MGWPGQSAETLKKPIKSLSEINVRSVIIPVLSSTLCFQFVTTREACRGILVFLSLNLTSELPLISTVMDCIQESPVVCGHVV